MRNILASRQVGTVVTQQVLGKASDLQSALRKGQSHLATGWQISLLTDEELEEEISCTRLANYICVFAQAMVTDCRPEAFRTVLG